VTQRFEIHRRERNILDVVERNAVGAAVFDNAARVIVVPVIVKLPEVLVRMMPLAPPLAETLVSDTASGVASLLRVIWTAKASQTARLRRSLGSQLCCFSLSGLRRRRLSISERSPATAQPEVSGNSSWCGEKKNGESEDSP